MRGRVVSTSQHCRLPRKGIRNRRKTFRPPGTRRAATACVVFARPLPHVPLQPCDLLVELGDLNDQQCAQLPNRARQPRLGIFNRLRQPFHVRRPLRRDDAELREVSPQRVDRLRALANQQIARAEQHALRLLLPRLYRHETHRRPRGRLADRLGVGGVVLLPLHERLHVDRRDQLHLMTELLELSAPVVRARTGLHRYDASRLRRHEAQHLVATPVLASLTPASSSRRWKSGCRSSSGRKYPLRSSRCCGHRQCPGPIRTGFADARFVVRHGWISSRLGRLRDGGFSSCQRS